MNLHDIPLTSAILPADLERIVRAWYRFHRTRYPLRYAISTQTLYYRDETDRWNDRLTRNAVTRRSWANETGIDYPPNFLTLTP